MLALGLEGIVAKDAEDSFSNDVALAEDEE